jgi:M6 family metalloprotease-like protein
MNGREVTLRQPDGSSIKVKAFGDEFFNWLETEDGHVIVRDPKTQDYCYARLSANGDEYESTGIPVDGKLTVKEQYQVQKLEKKIRISGRSRREKVESGLKSLGRDRGGRIILPKQQPVTSVQLAPSQDGSTTSGVAPSSAAAAHSVSGSFNALTLLAYFPDYPGEVMTSRAEVASFYNDVPYSGSGNAVSVRQYFQIQSNGRLNLSHVVTDWFVAPNNLAYYNVATPTVWTRFDELAIYRLEQLKAAGFDFRQLDANGDGAPDGISLCFAYDDSWIGGWAGSITWSGFADYGLSTSCPYQVSQMANPLALAIIVHELGHAICGFPDLYSYDGNAAGLGVFGLMANGNWEGGGHHPAAVCGPMKYQAGWVTAVDATASGSTSYGLTVGGTNVIRYVNPDDPKEYFLFEMRGEVGYEGPFGGSAQEVCPSKGLVAYHVKEDGSNSGSSIFTADNPNCNYSRPPMVLVLEDNPQTTYTPWYDKPTLDAEDAFDTGDQVNGSTTPNFNFWALSGRTIESGIGITGIQVGSSNLTFSIFNRNPPIITASPRIVLTNGVTTLSVAAPGMVSYAWSKISGPGTVTFGSSNAVVTTATFGNAPGSYLLRVTMSDGVNQIVSQISIQVIVGVGEYLGFYKSLPVGNNWHIGWVEIAGSKVQWRNADGANWTLNVSTDPDVFLTDATCPYYNTGGTEFRFVRENGQVTKFLFNGGTYYRCNPVANNMTLGTLKNTPVSVTLTATDVESEPVTYFVVTSPTKGMLTGTVPNLTYRPSTNYMGGDCFTFKATDGVYTSNLATVSIHVNAIPLVDAGTNKTVMLTPAFLPGLYYGTAAGDMNTTTPNPKTERLINVGGKTEDSIGVDTTEIYTGQIYDADGSISFTENIDDKAQIWIDGALVISNDTWNVRTSTANLNLSPGWHDIEIRIGNGSGRSGPDSGIGIGYDPSGGTNWMTLADPGDGSFLRVLAGSASVMLDGTVTDSDGDPLKTTWSKISGPGTVPLGNLYLVDTTATFTEAGTYVFRLSADDGSIQTNDDVVITILNEAPVVDYGVGAVPLSATLVSLQGVLAAGQTANGWICWGQTDGGTESTSGWERVVSMGVVTQGVTFSRQVTGLSTNRTYFYRCYVTSASGSDWSDTAEAFSGTPAGSMGGGSPVSGAYFEWDAAKDTPGDTTWKSTTNSYDWTFDGGVLSPVTVSDARFNRLTKAYAFPAAKDASNTSWNGLGDTQPATFEFVIDVDNADGSIFETGGSGDGLQVDIVGGVLRGTVSETTPARATYALTATDTNRFIHVVFVADNANNVLKLFVDGVLKDTQPWTLGEDWSGTDNSSLGGASGAVPSGGSVTSFTGKMALFRYYKNKALNSAEVSTNFTALCGTSIANLAPTAIDETAATFNAVLGASGTNYAVYAYYGANDGGTNSGSWTLSAYVGSWTNVSTNVSYTASLQSGTTYYYAFVASNASGRVWASPSWTFTTLGAAPLVTTNHSVPHAWLSAINTNWSANYEAAVTNDVDGDGYATWQEYWSGTDPQDSNSFLRIDSIGFIGTNLLVSWRHAVVDAGIPPITIQSSTNLVSGSWVGIGSHAPTNGVNTWSAGSSVQGFYRLAVTNAP